jgi:hypothetical protein
MGWFVSNNQQKHRSSFCRYRWTFASGDDCTIGAFWLADTLKGDYAFAVGSFALQDHFAVGELAI